jgi:hypothetical protein
MKFNKNIINKLLIGSFLFTGVMGTTTPLQGSARYPEYQKMSVEQRTQELCNLIKQEASIKEREEALINVGVDVDAKDSDGNTPLHLAVLQENLEIVKLLLAHGASIDIPNNSFEIALDLVGDKNMSQEIRKLVNSQSDRQKRTEELFDFLQGPAVYTEDIDEIKTLVDTGVNIHARDKNDNTSLHLAMYSWSRNSETYYNYNIIKALINKGAALNEVNCSGFTPLNFAYNAVLLTASDQKLLNRVFGNIKYLIEAGARCSRSTLWTTKVFPKVCSGGRPGYIICGLGNNAQISYPQTPERDEAVQKFLKLLEDNNAILDD